MKEKKTEAVEKAPEEGTEMKGQGEGAGSIQILEHAGKLMVKGWILMEGEE